MAYQIYTDGSCMPNPGPMGSAYVILQGETKLHEGTSGAPMGTNNQAEYIAIVLALRKLRSLTPLRSAVIYTDSKLVINQIEGKWKINNEQLRDLRNTVVAELRHLGIDYSFVHVRAHRGDHYNEYVDQLAKGACGGE